MFFLPFSIIFCLSFFSFEHCNIYEGRVSICRTMRKREAKGGYKWNERITQKVSEKKEEQTTWDYDEIDALKKSFWIYFRFYYWKQDSGANIFPLFLTKIFSDSVDSRAASGKKGPSGLPGTCFLSISLNQMTENSTAEVSVIYFTRIDSCQSENRVRLSAVGRSSNLFAGTDFKI